MVIIINSVYAYSFYKSKNDLVVLTLLKQIVELETWIAGCELIKQFKPYSPNYNYYESIKENTKKGVYWELKEDLRQLNNEFAKLTNYCEPHLF